MKIKSSPKATFRDIQHLQQHLAQSQQSQQQQQLEQLYLQQQVIQQQQKSSRNGSPQKKQQQALNKKKQPRKLVMVKDEPSIAVKSQENLNKKEVHHKIISADREGEELDPAVAAEKATPTIQQHQKQSRKEQAAMNPYLLVLPQQSTPLVDHRNKKLQQQQQTIVYGSSTNEEEGRENSRDHNKNNTSIVSQSVGYYNDTFMPKKLKSIFPAKKSLATIVPPAEVATDDINATISTKQHDALIANDITLTHQYFQPNVVNMKPFDKAITVQKKKAIAHSVERSKENTRKINNNLDFLDVMKSFNLPQLNSQQQLQHKALGTSSSSKIPTLSAQAAFEKNINNSKICQSSENFKTSEQLPSLIGSSIMVKRENGHPEENSKLMVKTSSPTLMTKRWKPIAASLKSSRNPSTTEASQENIVSSQQYAHHNSSTTSLMMQFKKNQSQTKNSRNGKQMNQSTSLLSTATKGGNITNHNKIQTPFDEFIRLKQTTIASPKNYFNQENASKNNSHNNTINNFTISHHNANVSTNSTTGLNIGKINQKMGNMPALPRSQTVMGFGASNLPERSQQIVGANPSQAQQSNLTTQNFSQDNSGDPQQQSSASPRLYINQNESPTPDYPLRLYTKAAPTKKKIEQKSLRSLKEGLNSIPSTYNRAEQMLQQESPLILNSLRASTRQLQQDSTQQSHMQQSWQQQQRFRVKRRNTQNKANKTAQSQSNINENGKHNSFKLRMVDEERQRQSQQDTNAAAVNQDLQPLYDQHESSRSQIAQQDQQPTTSQRESLANALIQQHKPSKFQQSLQILAASNSQENRKSQPPNMVVYSVGTTRSVKNFKSYIDQLQQQTSLAAAGEQASARQLKIQQKKQQKQFQLQETGKFCEFDHQSTSSSAVSALVSGKRQVVYSVLSTPQQEQQQ